MKRYMIRKISRIPYVRKKLIRNWKWKTLKLKSDSMWNALALYYVYEFKSTIEWRFEKETTWWWRLVQPIDSPKKQHDQIIKSTPGHRNQTNYLHITTTWIIYKLIEFILVYKQPIDFLFIAIQFFMSDSVSIKVRLWCISSNHNSRVSDYSNDIVNWSTNVWL